MTLVTCTPRRDELAGDRQDDRGADAAADAHRMTGGDELRLLAEGAGDVR